GGGRCGPQAGARGLGRRRGTARGGPAPDGRGGFPALPRLRMQRSRCLHVRRRRAVRMDPGRSLLALRGRESSERPMKDAIFADEHKVSIFADDPTREHGFGELTLSLIKWRLPEGRGNGMPDRRRRHAIIVLKRPDWHEYGGP